MERGHGAIGVQADFPSHIADWLEEDDHSRPFFRDPDFINVFGRPGPAMLRAAVDELKRRAETKAAAINLPIAWPARLGDHQTEG